MNIDEVVAAIRHEARNLVWPGEILEQLPSVTRRTSASGDLNLVSAYDLDAATAKHAIREEIASFKTLGRPFEWKTFSFDNPPNLVELLQSAGFEVGEREAVVVYDLEDGLRPFESALSCEVLRVDDERRLNDFRTVAEAVFKKDYSLTTRQLSEALATGERGHDGYVAYVDGKPVSIGRLYTNPRSLFAGFYGGGTLPEFRGHGYYRAVVASRAKDAQVLGSRYLLVDALPTSLPILKRLGFTHVADTVPCSYTY